MPRSRCFIVVLITLLISSSTRFVDRVLAESNAPAAIERVSYERHIRPIFQARCHGCHQPAKAEGDYVMTSFERLVRGGESGEPAIVATESESSYLVQLITPIDGEAEMPRDGKPLSADQRKLIAAWIEQGAENDSKSQAVIYNQNHPPRYRQSAAITSLDFSPDGQLLVVAGFHEVTVHTADGTARVARLIGMSPRIEDVEFSPNGKLLAVTGGSPSESGEVQIWDVGTRELKLSLPVSYDTIRGASWSPNGKFLAFACADNSVKAIDAETGKIVFDLAANKDWVLGTVFSMDGNHLACVSRDRSAKLFDIPKRQFVDNITSVTDGVLKGGIHCVQRHPLRDEIIFGGADGVPRIYRMFRVAKRQRDGDENLLWNLPQVPGRIFAIDTNQNGSEIAVASSSDSGGALHVYGMEAAPKIPIEIKRILNLAPTVRNSQQKQQLSDYFRQGVKELSKTHIPNGGAFAVAIHPTEKVVAIGGSDGSVRLIDTFTGQVEREFLPIELEAASTDNANVERAHAARIETRKPLQSLADVHRVVSLDVSPSRVRFTANSDYIQLVVTAKLNDGNIVDATRSCRIEFDSSMLSLSPNGIVRPRRDGSSVLAISLNDQTLNVPVETSNFNLPLEPDYRRDVAPVISRLGCNVGKCHGARDGKNGFKLSLRGYDEVADIRALTDDLSGRRVNRALPEASLMLRKATALVPHEGGQLLKLDSEYCRILHAWIAAGARLNKASAAVLKLDVYPKNPVVQRIGTRQQLRVVATYRDGYQRDVTQEAFVESGNAKVATTVDGHAALVEVSQRGEASMLVRYQGAYAATTLTVMGNRDQFVWQPQPSNNPIDDFIWKKLKRTKTLPSPLCNDYEFLRRVYLDLTGLPPTPDQIRQFINASGETKAKRNKLVENLVGSPEYVEHRSNKWADLLQVNGKFLGRQGATKFRQWIRKEIEANTPYDEFARKILTANGSNKDNPAASYYKILRDPKKLMANTTHLFMATRFTCNECHDHPFERWTQDDFYQMSAWFSQVDFKKDDASGKKKIKTNAAEPAYPLYEVVSDKQDGDVIHARTSQIAQPAFPFECEHDASENASRREQMAAWITSPDNPYFARSFANRIWGYFMGRGLIEPLDDIRAGNPPSHPELLDFLTREFIESDFNIRHLVRLICQSRAYQLSSQTNEWNTDDELNYSHAIPRRLAAEVIYDSIYRATGAKSEFPGVAKGMRAASLPDVGIKLPDGFLNNMGRPARESSCECERNEELQLGVVLALINSPTVNHAISSKDNEITSLAASVPEDSELVNEMFLRVLNRPANPKELEAGLKLFDTIDEQHQSLEEQLRSLENELRDAYKAAETERLVKLAQAERDLANYQKLQAPIRAKEEHRRLETIADARSELDNYQARQPQNLRRWEENHRNATSWTALDPIELIADYERTVFSVDKDSSLFVKSEYGEGEFGKGAYRLQTRIDLRRITGLRLDALTDDKLPANGPGRNAGKFVLTELELQHANADIGTAPVLADWQFENDAGTWVPMSNNKLTVSNGQLTVKSNGAYPAMSTQVQADSGDFTLEVVAKVKSQAMMRVYWSTSRMTDFDKKRSQRHGVFAGNEEWSRFRFPFKTDAPLTGIRLDLDKKNGQVVVESIRLLRHYPRFQKLAWETAEADASHLEGFDPGRAIDGQFSDDYGWSVADVGQSHVAIFTTKEPAELNDQSLVRILLHQNHGDGSHSLGKFRVSLTDSPQPLSIGIPSSIAKLIAIPTDQRTVEQQNKLASYHKEHDATLRRLRQKLKQAETPLADDPVIAEHEQRIKRLRVSTPINPKLANLKRKVEISQQQLDAKRITAVQDLAWALINTPEFLYNH